MNWLSEHTNDLGVDPDRIAIGGDSAGRSLAAVCTINARDSGALKLRLQLLIYPAVAPNMNSLSHADYGEGYLLTKENMNWFIGSYTGGKDLFCDPTYAPMIATDHSGLAPTEIIVAGYDPLRNEGIAYGKTLAASGVPTNVTNHAGAIHAFMQFYDTSQACRDAIDYCGSVIKKALST